jgi:hypothetical protein
VKAPDNSTGTEAAPADNKVVARQAEIIDAAIGLMENDYHWEIAQLRDAAEKIPAFETRDLIFEKKTNGEWRRMKAKVGETRKKWPATKPLLTSRAGRYEDSMARPNG